LESSRALIALVLGYIGLQMTLCGGFATVSAVFSGSPSLLFLIISIPSLAAGIWAVKVASRMLSGKGAADSTPGANRAAKASPSAFEDLSGVDKSQLGACSNCSGILRLNASKCMRCGVQFGPGSEWKIEPKSE